MGRRGPPRTATRVLKLRGTFRGDRHGAGAEPEYPPLEQLPDPPGFFDEIAVFEWNRIGPELVAKRLLTEVDLAPFTGYCLNVSRMVAAERKIAAMGLLVMTDFGPKANPAVMIARQSGAEVLKFAKEFGLTPASRTRVEVPDAGGSKPAKDPWEEVG
jgi:P27 family predicted phage terminase small subunit